MGVFFSFFLLPVALQAQTTTVAGNTAFAIDMYKYLDKQTIDDTQNIVFSPYSISSAMAMTYAGARGSTAAEIKKTMHFDNDDLHSDLSMIQDNFRDRKNYMQLSLINRIFVQKGIKVLPEFSHITDKYYKAKTSPLDFEKRTEASRKKINQWVEDKTKKNIKNLIPQGIIKGTTKMVLVNAILMNAFWMKQFEKEDNIKLPFRTKNEVIKEVEYMVQTKDMRYAEEDGFDILVKLCEGDINFWVLLPKKVGEMKQINKFLTVSNLLSLKERIEFGEGFSSGSVELTFPKFKISQDINVKKVLKGLGMSKSFSNAANFSGMFSPAPKIGAVIHKAFVEANEKGTIAGAATAVIAVGRGLSSNPKVFKIDHPFVFLITDNESGSVLFMGKVGNPKGE